MKRVKTAKQAGVRQSFLMAGLVLASVSAQASVTITAGNGNSIDLRVPGSISLQSPGTETLVIYNVNQPAPIQSSAGSLNAASASSSVSGSLYYSLGTSYGNFSENDSSPDGSMVELDLNRKGYGYRAGAWVKNGQAKVHAETQLVTGNGTGSSSASATSSWSDWFVISGGAGLSTASFTSVLDGMMTSGKNGMAGYSLNIGYSTGAYCYSWYSTCGEADQNQTLFSQTSSLSGKGKTILSQDIEGEFTFAYDKPFQLTAMFNTNAANGGVADFTLKSLGNSMVLPDGANLLSSSGLYVQAVPEAETYAMMLAGLGLVGAAVARRRAMPN